MIHFTCKQCGQAFERPEAAVGSLVFCGCGTANRVPWESTSPAPPPPEPEEVPAVRRVGRPDDQSAPRARRYEPRPAAPRDPTRCFNHPEAPADQACAACGERFCAGCVVRLEGQALCGPCKNFRLRSLERPSRVAVLAIVAPILGIFSGAFGPFAMLVALGAEAERPAVIVTALVGLAPALVVAGMGALALRQIEADPKVAGRSLALTALVIGLVSAASTAVLALVALHLRD
jgi:predicted  nucleic acid-binding Zn-ribbon protein